MTYFGKYLRKIVMHNFFLKAGSFILALILWFIVQIQGKIEQEVVFLVDMTIFRNLPENGHVKLFRKSDEINNSVKVRMRGIPSAMSNIENQKNIVIDLPEDFTDWGIDSVFELTNKNIQNVPFGVEILSINPSTITIMLDYYMEKEVPIIKSFVGQPAPGYDLVNVEITPEIVKISGPQTRIMEIEEVKTKVRTIQNEKETFNETIPLNPPGDDVISYSPESIAILFTIKETIIEREFKNKEITLKILEGTGTIATIEPERINVTVQGPMNILRNLDSSALNVILDVQELPVDKWRRVVPKCEFNPEFSSNLKCLKFDPPDIKVKVTKGTIHPN